MNKPPPPTKHV